jgi:hypothetical protein
MNTSNPYGTETIAREHQAEIERRLRQAAQLRGGRPRLASSRARLLLLAAAMIITLALVAAFV